MRMLGSKFLGDADQRWEPVFLNLIVTDTLILWLGWLLFLVANTDKNAIKVEFNKIICTTVFCGVAPHFNFASTGTIFHAPVAKLKIIHDGVVTVSARPAPGTELAASCPRTALAAVSEPAQSLLCPSSVRVNRSPSRVLCLPLASSDWCVALAWLVTGAIRSNLALKPIDPSRALKTI